jgi:hypothetical protein
MKRGETAYDVALVELALKVVLHIRLVCHVRRDEHVLPVLDPSRVVIVVVRRRRDSLYLLRIVVAVLSHLSLKVRSLKP